MSYTSYNEITCRLNEVYDRLTELRILLIDVANILNNKDKNINPVRIALDFRKITTEVNSLVMEESELRSRLVEIEHAVVESQHNTKQ